MIGNAIKQTTATTGTGPLTLAAVAGFPAISDVFALNVPVAYTLQDATGFFLEAGIGYLSSSTVFVRSKICVTFQGATYASAAPTAVSLTGTTTLIVTAHAAVGEMVLPTVDSQSASINRMVTTANRNTVGTANAMVALRLSYVPFLFRCASQIASLAISVGTAGAAGKVARIGLYACNEKGYPGALLATTNDLLVDTTGLKVGTLSTPVAVPPGWIFAAVVSDGTPTINMHSASASPMGGGPFGYSGTSVVDFRHETLASTTLPATANTTTTAVVAGAQHIPMVYAGVS